MPYKKTNAMRILDKAGIGYGWETYAFDENDLSGTHVAELVDMPTEQVFKTLVVRGERRGILVACIPVDRELDLKALARAAGEKRCELIPLRELLPATGYIRGGCSPIGMRKAYPAYMDDTARKHDRIAVSAGIRGCQILIAPLELAEHVGAEFHDLCM